MMINPHLWNVVLQNGLIMCIVSGGYLVVLLRFWPRVFLKRYPAEIREAVGPLSSQERFFGFAVSAPFLLTLIGFPAWASYRMHYPDATFVDLFLAAYLTWTAFNLFDWLVLDELLVGYLRPSWLTLPGTENIPMSFDHSEHAAAFLKGLIGGIPVSLVVAGIVFASSSTR